VADLMMGGWSSRLTSVLQTYIVKSCLSLECTMDLALNRTVTSLLLGEGCTRMFVVCANASQNLYRSIWAWP